MKQIPAHLVDSLSNTIAHEVLGQSIVYRPFKGVGSHIGQALNQLMEKSTPSSFKLKDRDTVMNVRAHAATASPTHNSPVAVPVASSQQGFNFLNPCVSQGEFVGLVTDISLIGVVTQKINRDGLTVQHALSALSGPVEVGFVANIRYADGVGVVAGKSLSTALGR